MLTFVLSALLAPPAPPPRGQSPAVPFGAVVYARYVMDYNDGTHRAYQSASAAQAARFVGLKAVPTLSLSLKPFGQWTTPDATYDPFDVLGKDAVVPGALFVYATDEPGPPTASRRAAALALDVERPTLSASAFQTFLTRRRQQALSSGYHLRTSAGQLIFSQCWKGAGTEYPVLNAAVTQNCVAETYAPHRTLRVQTMNMGEQATIRQLQQFTEGVR